MQPPYQETPSNRPNWKPWIYAGVFLALVLCGFLIYQALTFHIVRTDPSLSKVGSFSPYVQVYFNKPLEATSLRFSDTGSIVQKTSVDEKSVTFTFNPNELVVGKAYTIVLENITSEGGDSVTNKKLSFTVKDIDVTSLSSGQRQTIMKQQDNYPYSVTSIPFENFDELTNNGLSSDQEQIVKQAIFDYSEQAKTKFRSVVLDTASIMPGAFDPNSDAGRTLTFTITANNAPYGLTVGYDDISTAAVVINDQAGNPVYDNTTADGSDINSVEE